VTRTGYYQVNNDWYPEYPDLGAKVAKLRWGPDRKAHGAAVLEAIRAKNRALHMRPTPSLTPNRYKPPSITRLLHYKNPIPMRGDPDWRVSCKCKRYTKCTCDQWDMREKAVYTTMMEEKRKRSK